MFHCEYKYTRKASLRFKTMNLCCFITDGMVLGQDGKTKQFDCDFLTSSVSLPSCKVKSKNYIKHSADTLVASATS